METERSDNRQEKSVSRQETAAQAGAPGQVERQGDTRANIKSHAPLTAWERDTGHHGSVGGVLATDETEQMIEQMIHDRSFRVRDAIRWQRDRNLCDLVSRMRKVHKE
jgi:hypothetical protein